jgi:hypothetical protein
MRTTESFAVRSDDVATLRESFETMRVWRVAQRLSEALRHLRNGMLFEAGQDLASARTHAMDLEGAAKERALQLVTWVYSVGYRSEVALSVRAQGVVRDALAGKAA